MYPGWFWFCGVHQLFRNCGFLEAVRDIADSSDSGLSGYHLCRDIARALRRHIQYSMSHLISGFHSAAPSRLTARSLATRLRPQCSGSFSSSWAFNKNIFEDKEDAVGRACPMDIVPANTSWKAWETISSLAAAAAAIALDGRQSAFDFVSTYSHLIALCISVPGQTFRHSTEQRQQHHQPVICSAAAAVGLEKPPFIPVCSQGVRSKLPPESRVRRELPIVTLFLDCGWISPLGDHHPSSSIHAVHYIRHRSDRIVYANGDNVRSAGILCETIESGNHSVRWFGWRCRLYYYYYCWGEILISIITTGAIILIIKQNGQLNVDPDWTGRYW